MVAKIGGHVRIVFPLRDSLLIESAADVHCRSSIAACILRIVHGCLPRLRLPGPETRPSYLASIQDAAQAVA